MLLVCKQGAGGTPTDLTSALARPASSLPEVIQLPLLRQTQLIHIECGVCSLPNAMIAAKVGAGVTATRQQQ
jgi:hypothetical protein